MLVHHIINDIQLNSGGAQKIARILHSELPKQGIISRLVSLTKILGNLPDNAFSLDFTSPYALGAILKLCNYIKLNCADNDIIHTHLFPANFYTSLAVRFTNWPGCLVCTEHNTYNRRRGTKKGFLIDALLYSRYDHIACISEGVKSALAEWMPRHASRMTVIENGLPLPFKEFIVRPKKAKPLVVSVGMLERQKNYDTALKAMCLIKDLDFEYQIAGTGPEEAKLKALSADLDLCHKVKFLGFVDDIPSLLAKADVFLMPSRWEGFGLSAVEAMNAGLPVVASSVPGLREIVSGGQSYAMLIEPDNPTSISIAVKILLESYETRMELGEYCFNQSKRFSIDSMTCNYFHLYEMINKKNRSVK